MRKSLGQVALSLNLVIAIFIVGTLGFVSYEMSRILLAREQMQHCLELAALAGGAAIASTNLTGTAAESEGKTVATNILGMNSILGETLNGHMLQATSLSGLKPAIGQLAVYYEFDDPITHQPVAAGQQANVLRVYGAYAYPLFSGGFGAIGVSVWTVMAEATAGLPIVDVVIVYGNSGSNDDQTPVTEVRRYWDPTAPAISYYIPTPGGGGPDSGSIWTVSCPGLFGTNLNALPPQNLDAAGDPKVSSCIKEFSETGPDGDTVPLRGVTNTGDAPGDAPPGSGGVGLNGMSAGSGNTQDSLAFVQTDYEHDPGLWLARCAAGFENVHLEQPADAFYLGNGPDFGSGSYNPWNADTTMFTDLVVNLDGKTVFGGYTAPSGPFVGYPFTDISWLIEASRGNLENPVITPNVHTDNAMSAGKVGYQQAYQCLAYSQLQPKSTCENAVTVFMRKMLQTSDAHFGFVGFNDRAGTSATDTITVPSVSYAYNFGGNLSTKIALPQIQLASGSNNFATIAGVLSPPTSNAAPMFTPSGGSNLADGLAQAYNQLTGASRSGSYKAIIVLTDKVPDRDIAGNSYSSPASNGPALSDSITVAQNCKAKGIPIFVIALDQTGGGMTPYFQSQFNDTNASGGLVDTAGEGGQLYIVPWTTAAATSTNLSGDFNNIIRQLMSLVRG